MSVRRSRCSLCPAVPCRREEQPRTASTRTTPLEGRRVPQRHVQRPAAAMSPARWRRRRPAPLPGRAPLRSSLCGSRWRGDWPFHATRGWECYLIFGTARAHGESHPARARRLRSARPATHQIGPTARATAVLCRRQQRPPDMTTHGLGQVGISVNAPPRGLVQRTRPLLRQRRVGTRPRRRGHRDSKWSGGGAAAGDGRISSRCCLACARSRRSHHIVQ